MVDDGSKDDTVQKVSQLLARHKCIRLIRLHGGSDRRQLFLQDWIRLIGDFTVIMLPDSDCWT